MMTTQEGVNPQLAYPVNQVQSQPAQLPQTNVQQKTSVDGFTAFLTIFRTLTWISGPLLMAVGILAFSFLANLHLVTIFFSLYLILFGLLLFFAEFKWNKFLKYFPFLLTKKYRAVFLAFAGSLCFGVEIGGSTWPGVASGIWCIVIGVFYFIISCFRNDEEETKLKNEYKQEVEAHHSQPQSYVPESAGGYVPTTQV
ncbi:putative COPI associated protein [Monocercomonoides exilis]|uniref:putative COPI associated protein n=1 Tax=Monocercomonoides exilis TaxID=2049356 RepID=UPI003559B808|nr:putative COPI associated protein [Monocercomonoides exilis]|eukprot:MONOS_4574.1-p1 / transcript=MONOS_4574.1 / gene=MONOS_4574 / organism=Monocercomonoides_exilis_PA203 / gene_product=unspecified product / transcript_product=unspecified product / location=Mono_scaffold00123:10436-11244(+) / protein_length=197 / sequence_SO=supercontig / SO=protein_coding / is_pseudo=false